MLTHSANVRFFKASRKPLGFQTFLYTPRQSLGEFVRLKKTSIVVFPGAGHGIRMIADYKGEGRAPFADGYMEIQVSWLWENLLN